MTISRRTLLQVGAVGGGILMLPGFVQSALAATGKPRIRYDVDSDVGRFMLEVYARAVADMKRRPATDPLSWTFQWYTHAVPDSKDKLLAQVFGPGPSPQRALAEAMWFTCEPHFSGNDYAFLPWHRMYVLYLEDIVRKVSGFADFTMPYWNYTGPGCAPATCSVMPAQFRRPNDPLWGALYSAPRNPGVNQGERVNKRNPLDLNCMKSASYEKQGADAGFCNNIDNDPHGALHDDVGNSSQGMGSVNWAANDPIFWVHHSNIDRIWASWIKSGGRDPSDAAFLGQTWTFANSAGQPVKVKVSDVLNTETLAFPYTYAEFLPRPPNSVPFSAATTRTFRLHAQSALLATGAKAISLGDKPVSVPLQTPGLADAANLQAFSASLKAVPASSPYYLTLSQISASSTPGINYSVYLDLPAGQAPAPEGLYYVGTVSFFGVGMMNHGAGHQAYQRNISFVVTDTVAGLLKAGRLSQAPSVTLVPNGVPQPNSAPTIGQIALQSS